LRAELDEVAANGELSMVGVRNPEVDAYYGRRRDDRAYSVFTVRDGRIVTLRDCRDRQEALHLTASSREGGIESIPPGRPDQPATRPAPAASRTLSATHVTGQQAALPRG
jgi:hypothetical protein